MENTVVDFKCTILVIISFVLTIIVFLLFSYAVFTAF